MKVIIAGYKSRSRSKIRLLFCRVIKKRARVITQKNDNLLDLRDNPQIMLIAIVHHSCAITNFYH